MNELEEHESGVIELPPGAACRDCHYSELIRIGDNVRSVRICRRFPPGSLAVPNAQGSVLTSQPPIVPDDYYCFEFDKREPAVVPVSLV